MTDFRKAELDRLKQERDGWLEDVLAGLLAAAVPKYEIEVQHHPDLRIVVCVRGVPKYELASPGDSR